MRLRISKVSPSVVGKASYSVAAVPSHTANSTVLSLLFPQKPFRGLSSRATFKFVKNPFHTRIFKVNVNFLIGLRDFAEKLKL